LQVELIETAVEYIQSLEKEVKTLRSSVNEVPRSDEGVNPPIE
jgi:phage shock protein A